MGFFFLNFFLILFGSKWHGCGVTGMFWVGIGGLVWEYKTWFLIVRVSIHPCVWSVVWAAIKTGCPDLLVIATGVSPRKASREAVILIMSAMWTCVFVLCEYFGRKRSSPDPSRIGAKIGKSMRTEEALRRLHPLHGGLMWCVHESDAPSSRTPSDGKAGQRQLGGSLGIQCRF